MKAETIRGPELLTSQTKAPCPILSASFRGKGGIPRTPTSHRRDASFPKPALMEVYGRCLFTLFQLRSPGPFLRVLGTTLAFIRDRELPMRIGESGVGRNRLLVARNGLGDLPLQQQLIPGVQREIRPLPVNGGPAQFGALPAVLDCPGAKVFYLPAQQRRFLGIVGGLCRFRLGRERGGLFGKHPGQGHQRPRLPRLQRNRLLQCLSRFVQPAVLLERAAQDRPGVAVVGTQCRRPSAARSRRRPACPSACK